MHRLRRAALVRALMALDLAALGLALAVATGGGLPGRSWWATPIRIGDALLAAAWLAAAHVVFRELGLYRSQRVGSRNRFYALAASAVALASVAAAAGGAGCRAAGMFAVLGTATTIGLREVLFRLLAALRRRGYNLRYILVIGAGPRGRRLAAALESRVDLGCRVVGFIDEGDGAASLGGRLLGGFSDVERVLRTQAIDELLVALPLRTFYEQAARIVALGEERGKVVRVAGDLFEARLARLETEQVEDLSLLTLFTGRGSAVSHALKRMADLAGAAAALAILTPVFAVIALAVKLDSPGPVFFGQTRVGQNGRRFRMWKFRSMTPDAEDRLAELECRNDVVGAAFKMRDDPRVTRVGRWLRRTSLDELPQLVNVLRGEMSLVGPRPLPVRDVERMSADWQRRRFSVRPGLTGLWQAGGRHQVAFDEWMRLDLDYIDNWSLLLDLKILLRTVPAVWTGAGAS